METVQALHRIMDMACKPALVTAHLLSIKNDLKVHRTVERSGLDDKEIEMTLIDMNIPLIFGVSQCIMDQDVDYLETYAAKEEFSETTLEAYRMGQFKQGIPGRHRAAAVLLYSGNFWSTLYSSRDRSMHPQLTSTQGWEKIGNLLEDTWPMVLALMKTVPSSKNPMGGRVLFGLTARAWEELKDLGRMAQVGFSDSSEESGETPSWHSLYGTVSTPAHPFYGARCDAEVLKQLEFWKDSFRVKTTPEVRMAATVEFEAVD